MTTDEKVARMIFNAEENVKVSYRSGGKEIENEGKVSLILQFENIHDMLTLRDDLFPKAGIRLRDALDDDVYFNRQFIAQMNVPEEVRVTRHETKEG